MFLEEPIARRLNLIKRRILGHAKLFVGVRVAHALGGASLLAAIE
jgi:hypothetical protein